MMRESIDKRVIDRRRKRRTQEAQPVAEAKYEAPPERSPEETEQEIQELAQKIAQRFEERNAHPIGDEHAVEHRNAVIADIEEFREEQRGFPSRSAIEDALGANEDTLRRRQGEEAAESTHMQLRPSEIPNGNVDVDRNPIRRFLLWLGLPPGDRNE
jgi:hypothetical protein